MKKIMVAGIGTDVGKTVASAVLTTLMEGDYWKPIQCGCAESSDTAIMHTLIDTTKHRIYMPAYSFTAPLSPHQAAALENVEIDLNYIVLPATKRPLIIEGVGGVCVPLTNKILSIDLFQSWHCSWVIVSKHYLGSINHTLMTVKALKYQKMHMAGLIFNGEYNPANETIILEMTHLPLLGRLLPEDTFNKHTVQKYAIQWKSCFTH